jgi:hypothetical protein
MRRITGSCLLRISLVSVHIPPTLVTQRSVSLVFAELNANAPPGTSYRVLYLVSTAPVRRTCAGLYPANRPRHVTDVSNTLKIVYEHSPLILKTWLPTVGLHNVAETDFGTPAWNAL